MEFPILCFYSCNLIPPFQDGLTPLAHAAKEGSVEIVDLLLQKGAYVNLPDRVSSFFCLVFSMK